MRRILLAVVLVGLCAEAEASVLCQKKNGALLVKGVCKEGQTQVDPPTLGLQGPLLPDRPYPAPRVGIGGPGSTVYLVDPDTSPNTTVSGSNGTENSLK